MRLAKTERVIGSPAGASVAPDASVAASNLQLPVAKGPLLLEQGDLSAPHFSVDEVADSVLLHLLERAHAEYRQERRVRVEDLACFVGYVDPLAKILGEARQRFRIAQASVALARRSGLPVTQ